MSSNRIRTAIAGILFGSMVGGLASVHAFTPGLHVNELETDRSVLKRSPGERLVLRTRFSEPKTGDLYLAAMLGNSLLFFNSNNVLTPSPAPFRHYQDFSGTETLLDMDTQQIPSGTYPLYQVVTVPNGNVLNPNDWVGGLSSLSAINFVVDRPVEVTHDYNEDGFPDTDQNRDGFHDDDFNRDGFHDDDFNRDGFHDTDSDRDGFHDDDLDRDGYHDDDFDRDGFHDGDSNRDGFHDNDADHDGFQDNDLNHDGFGDDDNNEHQQGNDHHPETNDIDDNHHEGGTELPDNSGSDIDNDMDDGVEHGIENEADDGIENETDDDMDDEDDHDVDNDDDVQNNDPDNNTVSQPPVTPPATTGNGQTLYSQNCASCHGTSMVGRSMDATRIRSAINTNRGGMGSLSGLSDTELADIARYLSGQ